MISALALVLLTTSALAAGDAGVSCMEVEQRLAASQRTLAACTEASRAQTTAHDRCAAELQEAGEKTGAVAAKVEACVAQKDALCDEAAALAAALLQGHTRGVGTCIPAATTAQLEAQLNAWAAASAAYTALGKTIGLVDDYATGSTDVVPHPTGASETERRLARLLGARTGVPLWNRRLLVAAFKLTAPNAWTRLKNQGSAALDAFFDSRGPLPEGFIVEANGEHPEPAGPAGPPLTAALRVALSYLELSDCEARAESPECGRARQLVELLDDTGPLIVRRRVEEMYATPCDALGPDTVRAWLQDFPTSRTKEKQATLATLSAAAKSKLFHCYLADPQGDAAYAKWVAVRLPSAGQAEGRVLPLVAEFQQYVREGDTLDLCGRAVRAFQQMEIQGCGMERPEPLTTIALWAHAKPPASPPPDMQVCQKIAALLWSGTALALPHSPEEQVKVVDDNESTMTRFRRACDERQGTTGRFEQTLTTLAAIAQDLGEPITASPWRLDEATKLPVEMARIEDAERYGAWVEHTLNQEPACEALGMPQERCAACRATPSGYDCDLTARLNTTWHRYRRITAASAVGLGALLVVLLYLRRLRRARQIFAVPMRGIAESLEALGIKASPDALRWVLPARHDALSLELPRTPAWDRWGVEAVAVLSPSTTALREADVNHAAALALRENLRVVFLLHPDSAIPDLGAVRATLDWAARGGTRAVQVLPLALSRLAWATRDEDLLDLVEATTLRGNPFEVRGPVRSSSQFWNRERLVAGLLTEARMGHWVVVTGLRRFGKSSLALEVARRTTGPTAYVDLAGFHHEVSHGESPAVAVEAILRTLVMRLADSAAARYPAATLPAQPTGALDAPALAGWLRALSTACGTSSGSPPPPMLLVLDEVEQLLSAPPEKLGRALDVMATLAGRLRSAFSEPSSPHAGSTVSVVLCAALHPLLWAPLSTLGGQSLMGAFPSICVPALDDDAAHAMMRGLGSRQGIRFEDDALGALVKASHGVPLLLRRLGTSVLELYDADRARQGALGAVRIGTEGATEAIHREEREGSPLRVWVESEIAQVGSSAGVLLRALANEPRVTTVALCKLVENQVMERFTATGLTAHLAPAELKRRAQEAGSVMVRLLAESRLLEAHGDLTSPEAYSLPDGVLRRILAEGKKA